VNSKILNRCINGICRLSFCLTVVILVILSGCGKQSIDTQIKAKVAEKDIRLPTAQNIQDWWSSWDKKSFIIGAVESSELIPESAVAQIKKSMVHALVADLSSQSSLPIAHLQSIEGQLVQGLRLERQSLINDAEIEKNPVGFDTPQQDESQLKITAYFLSLENIQSIFRLAAGAGLARAVDVMPSLENMTHVARLMSVIGRSWSVAWVEPSLLGYLPKIPRSGQDSPLELAPEFKYNTSIVSVLKRVRADSAYSFVEKSKQALSSVTVAVLDTGVDVSHPELKDQMFINPNEKSDGIDNDNNCFVDDIHGIDATFECGRDDGVAPQPGFADLGGPGKACPRVRIDDELSANCGHGSHVAGIVAAKHGGDLSTLGICPSCKILSVRVAERCLQPDTNQAGECRRPTAAYDPLTSYEVDGGISDTSQVRALTYLYNLRAPDNPSRLLVNVVNLSLGKYFASRTMSYIIRNLQRKNIIVVAAAGNDGTETPSYPAAYDSVVAVCATSEDYANGAYGRAPFSNFGDWVDVCAPGTDIVSTIPGKTFDGGGLFVDKSGTSQATPFVAGALGYLLSYYGNNKSAAQIVELLKGSADSESLYNAPNNRVPGTGERLYRACYTDTSNCDNLLGAGFIDLDAAVQGKKQSKTNFNFMSNQPGGCVVGSIGQVHSLKVQVGYFLSGMPFVLMIGLLLMRFAQAQRNIRSRREKSCK